MLGRLFSMSEQERSLCTFCSSLGFLFISGRSFESIALDPVRDAFDGVPEASVFVRLWRHVFQLSDSLILVWGQKVQSDL